MITYNGVRISNKYHDEVINEILRVALNEVKIVEVEDEISLDDFEKLSSVFERHVKPKKPCIIEKGDYKFWLNEVKSARLYKKKRFDNLFHVDGVVDGRRVDIFSSERKGYCLWVIEVINGIRDPYLEPEWSD